MNDEKWSFIEPLYIILLLLTIFCQLAINLSSFSSSEEGEKICIYRYSIGKGVLNYQSIVLTQEYLHNTTRSTVVQMFVIVSCILVLILAKYIYRLKNCPTLAIFTIFPFLQSRIFKQKDIMINIYDFSSSRQPN